MGMNVRRNAIICIKIGISVGILAMIFTRIQPAQLFAALRATDIRWVLPGLVLIPVMLWLAAIHLKIATDRQGMRLRVGRLLTINFISSFYGLFLPGYIAGGVIKWYRCAKPDGKRAEAFAALLFNRYIDLVVMCLLAVLFWFLDPVAGSNPSMGIFLAGMTLALTVTGVVAANTRLLLISGSVLKRLSAPESVRRMLKKLHRAFVKYRGIPVRTLGVIVLLNVIRHGLGTATYYCFCRAVSAELSFVNVGWIRAVMILLMMIPASIAGFGLREGGLIFLLARYGVPTVQALAVSCLLLLREITAGLIGGILEVWRWFTGTVENDGRY